MINYSISKSPLGYVLLAVTDKGICAVELGDNKSTLESAFKKEFKSAQDINHPRLKQWTRALIDYLAGRKPWPLLPYDVRASQFQQRVWEFLRAIPSGGTYNYSSLAKAIGQPKAARAVASACAANPVALVIPCHRIVPKSGGVGGYRWGSKRKEFLLELERNQ